MKFQATTLALLASAAMSLASPTEQAAEAQQVNQGVNGESAAEALAWGLCAMTVACNDDSDCTSQQDCIDFAEGDESNIHCGLIDSPHSCWAQIIYI